MQPDCQGRTDSALATSIQKLLAVLLAADQTPLSKMELFGKCDRSRSKPRCSLPSPEEILPTIVPLTGVGRYHLLNNIEVSYSPAPTHRPCSMLDFFSEFATCGPITN